MRGGLLTATVAILVLGAGSLEAQTPTDEERLYRQRCARCHDSDIPIDWLQGSIRDLPAERIYEQLVFGAMQRNAVGLTKVEKRALAEYVSGSAAGSLVDPIEQLPPAAFCGTAPQRGSDPLSGANWNGWSPSLGNARFQTTAAAGLTVADLDDLGLKWSFGFPGVTQASFQATVVGGRVFVGTSVGLVYSLDADSGCIVWVHEVEAGVRSTVVVGSGEGGRLAAYFGDTAANVYAVDYNTGQRQWAVNVDEHPDARITGAPAFHDGRLYVPVASLEEVTAGWGAYECCTFRGSIVALDAVSGDQLWKTYTIPETSERTDTTTTGVQRWGPSGVGVWASPTLAPDRNALYIATGDSYSDPVAPTSDALMALDMETGQVEWVLQTTPGDAWTVACVSANENHRAACPESEGPDHDFGSSIVHLTSSNGASVLIAGQKSGVLYRIDPEDGTVQWETRVSDGGVVGGIEWGFAVEGDTVFASISDFLEKAPGEAGGVAAVQVSDGAIIWEAPPFQDTCGNRAGCHTGQPGAVTAIPGAIFSGSLDGYIRAYGTETGDVVWSFDTAREYDTVNGVNGTGGSLNGPGATIADGTVYVSSGYSFLNSMPGNVLLAFTVQGQ